MSRSIRRVLSSCTVTGARPTVIHLGYSLPSTSSDLPASSGGPPSNACCLTLLQVGFAEPLQSPGVLVVSYTTVSPLPRRLSGRSRMVHRGGLFSVALSRGSPRVAVSHHLALRSPDVPRRCALPGTPGSLHRRDRLTDSSMVQHRSSYSASVPPRWTSHRQQQRLSFPQQYPHATPRALGRPRPAHSKGTLHPPGRELLDVRSRRRMTDRPT